MMFYGKWFLFGSNGDFLLSSPMDVMVVCFQNRFMQSNISGFHCCYSMSFIGWGSQKLGHGAALGCDLIDFYYMVMEIWGLLLWNKTTINRRITTSCPIPTSMIVP